MLLSVRKERQMKHVRIGIKNHTSFFISIILTTLFIISAGAFWWQARHYQTVIMTSHLVQLASIFKDINATAGITDFEHQRNYIDFLNVKKFKGSTLGSMNLTNPDRWRGPYVTKNPTLQEKYYEIVLTDQGYFIAPGYGVVLANGKIVGKDIDIASLTHANSLNNDKNQAHIDGVPFAIKIATHGHPFTNSESSLEISPYDLLD
jgi:hypothetical protein